MLEAVKRNPGSDNVAVTKALGISHKYYVQNKLDGLAEVGLLLRKEVDGRQSFFVTDFGDDTLDAATKIIRIMDGSGHPTMKLFSLFKVLKAVGEAYEGILKSALMKNIGFFSTSVVAQIKSLEEAGLIKMEVSGSGNGGRGRRGKNCRLTDTARSLVEKGNRSDKWRSMVNNPGD